MNRYLMPIVFAVTAAVAPWSFSAANAAPKKPNVVMIVIDDLNDYVSGLGGHPQAETPNIARLAKSGVLFTHAYSNNPICAPSRSSFFTGIYPHTSKNLFWDKWFTNPVLKNSKTIMEHFHDNGYFALGSGKLMHHHLASTWDEYGYKADYGPFVYDGKKRVAHPSVPEPFRSIGPVDGSFAPLSDVPFANDPTGKKGWIYGTWGKVKRLRYVDPTHRDPTPDERNAAWAVKKIKGFATAQTDKPFFLAVGFIRPHTPLHVPKRFFDMFPRDSVKVPVIKPHDADDCHYLDVFPPTQKGPRYFHLLQQSYPTTDKGLQAFVQAYLACIAAVDELVGQVVEAVTDSPISDDTVILLTSDHGYNMGAKDYLFKNALWEESARVPFIIRAPGVSVPGGRVEQPVSLIDIYPTLVDLCGLTGDTRKNEHGAPLDGHSVKPLLQDPAHGKWDGPEAALTMIFSGKHKDDPWQQHWSVRTKRWRYILYNNGAEELYDETRDPYEWDNLAERPQLLETKKRLHALLLHMTGRE